MLISSFDDLSVNTLGIEESQDLNAFPANRDKTLVYLIDRKDSMYEWSSEFKDKLSRLPLETGPSTILQCFHPNNL